MMGMLLRMLLPRNTSRSNKTNDCHPFLRNNFLCFDSLRRPLFLSISIVSWMFINVLNQLISKTETSETLAVVSCVLPFTVQIKIQREGLISSHSTSVPFNLVIYTKIGSFIEEETSEERYTSVKMSQCILIHIKQKEAKGQWREMPLFAAALLKAVTLGFLTIRELRESSETSTIINCLPDPPSQ